MQIEELFPSDRLLQAKPSRDPGNALRVTKVRFLDRCLTVENHIHICYNSSQVQYQHH
jgi:hypothetical protein